MPDAPRKVSIVFYKTTAGADVVLDWLRAQEPDDRSVIGQDLMRVQFRWPVGMPLCRPLSGGLWEVRSNLARGRIARVFFCFTSGKLVALHGIIKKAQKTPRSDLELARSRQRDFG